MGRECRRCVRPLRAYVLWDDEPRPGTSPELRGDVVAKSWRSFTRRPRIAFMRECWRCVRPLRAYMLWDDEPRPGTSQELRGDVVAKSWRSFTRRPRVAFMRECIPLSYSVSIAG